MTKHKFTVPPITDEEEAEIQRQIASDPENPELTDEQLANMRPFREVFPDMVEAIEAMRRQRGRPPLERPKKAISIRLDQDVIDKFKATGSGWQSRMNDVLRAAKL